MCASAMAVMRMHGIEFTKGVSPLPTLLACTALPTRARLPSPALPPSLPPCGCVLRRRGGRVQLSFHRLLLCPGHHDSARPAAVAAGCPSLHDTRLVGLPCHAVWGRQWVTCATRPPKPLPSSIPLPTPTHPSFLSDWPLSHPKPGFLPCPPCPCSGAGGGRVHSPGGALRRRDVRQGCAAGGFVCTLASLCRGSAALLLSLALAPPSSWPPRCQAFTSPLHAVLPALLLCVGGMDQAISIMGMPGIAKLVEFNPVSGERGALGRGGVHSYVRHMFR